MTTPSKYFPRQTPIQRGRNRKIEITVTKEKHGHVPADVTAEQLAAAGIISSDPNAKRAKPVGSSPALRIACPVCKVPAGSYCTKLGRVQTIAHKKRRDEEERTR